MHASTAALPDPASSTHPALLVPRRRVANASRWKTVAWRLLALAAAVAAVLWLKPLLITEEGRPKKRAQRVTLVSAPKPPPPRPVEKPPELTVARQEVEVAAPAAQADAAPQDSALGVDADGEGAGDGFGLVGKRGGQDIVTLGDDAGGAGEAQRVAFGLYAALVRQRLEGELAGNRRLTQGDHASVVDVWIDARGRLERMDISRSSGNAEVDRALRDAFAAMPVLPEPPVGMPLPLRMRITSKELHGSR